MPLTNIQIKSLKPEAKIRKYFDGGGLQLVVLPSGSKTWRLSYRLNKKPNSMSLGSYPSVSLQEAREKRDEAKKHIARGIDPHSRPTMHNQSQLFENIAKLWHDESRGQWTNKHANDIWTRLSKYVLPYIGSRPIRMVEVADLLYIIKRFGEKKHWEQARRVRTIIGQVFRWAVAHSLADRDLSQDLRGTIPKVKSKNFAALLNPMQVGTLLRVIDDYAGDVITRYALKFTPLVFARPGELQGALWEEIDFENALWRISPERMKMERYHLVPLARQSIKLLTELKSISGDSKFLFRSIRSKDRHISNNTVNAALRRMGYTKDDMTGHGFRSTASTLLNEHLWDEDAIELQLAHVEGNKVRGSYNHAEKLDLRREMMQWWADYLDELKEKSKPTNLGMTVA